MIKAPASVRFLGILASSGDTSLRHFRGQTWNLSEPDLVVQTPKEQALDCQVEVFVVEASPLTVSLDKSSTNARIVAMEERL